MPVICCLGMLVDLFYYKMVIRWVPLVSVTSQSFGEIFDL